MKPTPLSITTIYRSSSSGHTLAALLVTSDLQHAMSSYERACLDEAEHEDAEIMSFQKPRPLQPGDQIFTPTQGYELTSDGANQFLPWQNALLTILIVNGHQAHTHLYRVALPATTSLQTWLDNLTDQQQCDLPLLGNENVPLGFYGEMTLNLWWESENQQKQQERLLAELRGLANETSTPEWAFMTGKPLSVQAFRQLLREGRKLTCVYRHLTNAQGEMIPPMAHRNNRF